MTWVTKGEKEKKRVKALPTDLDQFSRIYIVEFHYNSISFGKNVQGGGARQKYWSTILGLFKSAVNKMSVQKHIIFSKANKIEFHIVLSHFFKCRDLCLKVLRDCPK